MGLMRLFINSTWTDMNTIHIVILISSVIEGVGERDLRLGGVIRRGCYVCYIVLEAGIAACPSRVTVARVRPQK